MSAVTSLAPPEALALKPRHIPSLDGLRAVSISLVLIGHLSGTRHFWEFQKTDVGDIAHLGVVVFFVISGFLITALLITEHAERSSVSLKLFYARRALRILPAYYTYLAVISLLWFAGLIKLHARDLSHSVSYTVNYQPFVSWQIGHLWSLSVEEQFYLVWPLAFVVFGRRRAAWIAGGVMLLGPVARLVAWILLRGNPYGDLQMFPMVGDSLAAGCLLAEIRPWLESQEWYLQLLQPMPSFLLLLALLALNRMQSHGIAFVAGVSLINIILAVLVHRAVYCSEDWVGRVLNWKPLVFVGLLSYSLYLWQQPFLNRHSDAWVNVFPQNLIFAILAALASYLLLERPLFRLRHRLRAQS